MAKKPALSIADLFQTPFSKAVPKKSVPRSPPVPKNIFNPVSAGKTADTLTKNYTMGPPVPVVPAARRPGAYGSPVAGPPAPITPGGSTPRAIAPAEVAHAAAVTQVAVAKRDAAAKRFTARATALNTFLDNAPKTARNRAEAQQLNQRFALLRGRVITAQTELARHVDHTNSVYTDYGTLLQRAHEFEQAQQTGGVFDPGPVADWQKALASAPTTAPRAPSAIPQPAQPAQPAWLSPAPSPIPTKPPPGFVAHPSELTSGSALGPLVVPKAIGESLLPIQHGGFGTPEAWNRTQSLASSVAQGIIGTSTWGGKEFWKRLNAPDFSKQMAEFHQRITAAEKKKGRPLTAKETKVLAAGLPAGGLGSQNVINFAAALGGAVVGANEHPFRAIKEGAKTIAGIGYGSGLLVAALSADITDAQRQELLAQMPKGVLAEYTRIAGRGLSPGQAFEQGRTKPIQTLLDAPLPVSAAAQGLRIGALMRLGLPGGVDLAEAVRLARAPAKGRVLRYTERAPKGSDMPNVVTEVPAFHASSVLTRNVLQRPYDAGSRLLDALPGARALPIAESKRAARALAKNVRRSKNRLGGEAFAAFRDVQSFLNQRNLAGKKVNEHYATTLAVLTQKPKGFTDQEWEQAIIQNLKDMRNDPENMTLPGDTVTPAEQRIINRINIYNKKAEVQRVQKKGRAVRRVSDEQGRLADTLDGINTTRAKVREELRNTEADPNLKGEQRGAEVTRYQGYLRALDSEGKIIRDKLEAISVDQPPVVSANRDRFRSQLEEKPYFQENPQAVEDALAIGDAAARNWAKAKGEDPGAWWDLREPVTATAQQIPAEAFRQIRFDLNRTLSPEKAAENLRIVEGGDLHKPHLGHQENKSRHRFVKGERIRVFGDITPEEWVKRQRVLVPDPVERDQLARWYKDVGPTIERFFGEDAQAIFRGFAVSQANASPAIGLGAVLRIFDRIKRGEVIGPNEASVVSESIAAAIRGEHVSEGLAAKLHDFSDSIQGKSTRTWMGDDPRGGWPVANDIHAIRDLGYIDKKLVNRLIQPEPGAMFSRGFKRSEFKVDSGGTPGKHQYERMREKYTAITDHLNEIGFDGRNDWTPSQVQALGWSSIQRLHGATPEDLNYAVGATTRQINLEVTKGISGVGKDLTMQEASAVARAVEPVIRDIVDSIDGLYWERDIETGVSAYQGEGNASLHFSVRGSPEKTHDLVDRLSEAFDQYDVWATREISSDAKPTLVIAHPDLADPDKAMALYKELYAADKKRYAGFMTGEDRGQPAIKLIMPGDVVTKASHDERLAELNATIQGAVERSLSADTSVEARIANVQIIGKEWKGGKGHKRGLDRTGSERALHDSLATEARSRLQEAVDSVRSGRQEQGPRGPAGRQLNQARRGDTLGATQLLDSASGQRIIWLTEHSDFSTVVHELLGHASEEMANLHPEEFAKVEQIIGKPLDEWDVVDHEKFATWFERYLSEGYAPTPELVPVFDRAKQYMRVIYAQIRRALGGRIPAATRDLFDHYLGGWDSESATRIAMDMGTKEPADSRWAGASAAAQQELATLQKRNRTRRFNRSIEGQLADLKRLEKEAENRGALNQEERDALTAKIVRARAEIVIRSDKRVKNLDSKISDMEKALNRDPGNRRFSGALESAKWMMDDRTRILKEVFGPEMDAIFDNREDLLANYLVQHGLLTPDFEHGSGSYYPMKLDEGFWQAMTQKVPMVPASNRVIGQVQKAMVGVHHRNEMIRWQAGDWSADPMTLQLAHARATSYQFILEVRDLMHSMGRKLSFDEEHGNFPNKGYLINLKGTPLSHDLRIQTRGMTNTTTVDHLDDGLLGDNAKLEASLEDFFRNSVIDMKNLPAGFDLADPDLRFISADAVHKIFRPVNLNLGGKAWDVASTAARFGLIYANAPGYMITNLVGNFAFLTLQSGVGWIPRTVAYSKMLANDAYLRERIAAEAGELPAQAAIIRGRNFGQRAGEAANVAERKWLQGLSIVDKYPRMVAWLTEANKAGYYSKDSLIRLLDGKTPKTVKDRERVSEYTNQHMIDFTYRVSDRERQSLGRLFFIWPYVRGATALPFWYAKNYPGRTALLSQLALQQRIYQQSVLGDLPPGREDLYPLSRRGGNASVVGTRWYNPAGPLPDEIRLGSDLVASAFGRVPDNLSARLSSLLNANIEGLTSIFTGKDAYGRDVSLKSAVLDPYGIADTLIPFQRYVRAALSDQYIPRAFREGEGGGVTSRLAYAGIRVLPHTVKVDWLNAAAQSTASKPTSEKIKDAVALNEKQFHAVEGRGAHYPNSFRKQIAAKIIYGDRVYALERDQAAKANFVPKNTGTKDRPNWDFGYHADNYDQAMVAYAVMKQNMPEVLAQHPHLDMSPNAFLAQHGVPPRSVKGEDLVSLYTTFFNDHIDKPPGIHGIEGPIDYAKEYADKVQEGKYFKEKAAGAYG